MAPTKTAEHHWFWQFHKANPKAGLNRLFRTHSGLHGAPATGQITNKLVSETFWPDSLDRESTKAARILNSFCKHGMYQDEARDPSNHTTQKQKMWSRIPQDVIANAKGLVIFTIMRAGLWVSGAGGSGVVLVRTPRGSWSWPIAIELQTAELGFLVGVDIYDSVLVLNTTEAVDAFAKSRCIIGGDLYATPGPLGVGWFFDKDARSRQSPIFSYLRSRGYYAAVQLDHAVVVERAEENRKFYQLPNLSPKDIFAGDHAHRPASCLALLETIKASEGVPEVDENLLPVGPPPSDFEVVEEGYAFGVPDKEDPDPYGVLALEKQGLLIREAGTKTSPTTESFEFNPSITSPIYARYNRRSADGTNLSVRSSWRRSVVSTGDRNDAGSVLSRDTDQDSVSPASPNLNSNSRSIHLVDNDTNTSSTTRNLANGHPPTPADAILKRENSATSRPHMSNGRQQTIYEDEDEGKPVAMPLMESPNGTSVIDDMVEKLHGKGKEPADEFSKNLQASPESEHNIIGHETKPNMDAEPEPEHNITGKETKPDMDPSPERDLGIVQEEETSNLNTSLESGLGIKLDTKPSEAPLSINTAQLDEDDADVSDLDSDSDGSASPVEFHDVVIHSGGPPTMYHQAVSSVTMPKARIVNVAKPAPPLLPPRHPDRMPSNSATPSLDERTQPEFPSKRDSSSRPDGMPSSEISPPTTPPPQPSLHEPETSIPKPYNEPVSPVESLKSSAKDLELETSPPQAEDENKAPEVKTTMMDIHKNLNASPSPEASSPDERRRSYFS